MIDGYAFGRISIAGQEYDKDIKIVRGRVVANWWRTEGHRLDATDLQDVLAAKPDVLVVGTGAYGAMRVAAGLRSRLEQAGIELMAEPSTRAVEIFNRLLGAGRDVAGAFHLTC